MMPARTCRLVVCVVKLLALVACGDAEPPHLFLITADALRADHLSHTGYPRNTSPQIDAFAAEALDFGEAVTLVPKTGPAFASHFTGLEPGAHGVTSNTHALPEDVPVLAEMLRERGYATAAFVSNPILSTRKGFDRGFDTYQQFRKTGGLDELTDAFAAWAKQAAFDRPTFVWIHFIDPHGPYTPPEALRNLFTSDDLFRADTRTLPVEYEPPVPRRPNRVLGAVPRYQRQRDEGRVAWYVSQYDAEIRHMDDNFGRVLDLLRERGLYRDAGVVFTADHGESMGEHDYFFEHGWFTYDATLRIPLLVKPPGPPQPTKRQEQTSGLDLLPTLLDLAGIVGPPELKGSSLLRPLPAARPVLAQNPSTYSPRFLALRTPSHKWIQESGSGREELYDLALDPAETRNLVASEPGLAAELRKTAEHLGAAAVLPPARTPRTVQPSAEEAELLEQLGYGER